MKFKIGSIYKLNQFSGGTPKGIPLYIKPIHDMGNGIWLVKSKHRGFNNCKWVAEHFQFKYSELYKLTKMEPDPPKVVKQVTVHKSRLSRVME